MDVARLFDEHHPALYRYLLRLSGDPDLAADAAQEAFSRMIERTPRDEHPRAWLFKVATNVVRDRSRSRSRRRRLLEEAHGRLPVADSPKQPDAAAVAREDRERVVRALARLSDKERTILLMREEGFAHGEIAAAVGTTTRSVGTMVARALNKLAAVLDLDGENAP